jgi:hypothetical protein
MKKILLFALTACLAVNSYAQKVDLDRHWFSFNYRDLPAKPLNPEYRTYSVNITAASNVSNNHSSNELQDAVYIEGWKKVAETNGHLVINVSLQDLMIVTTDVKNRQEIIKDKEGKETGRKTFYWVEMAYSWGGQVDVKDYNKKMVALRGFGSVNNRAIGPNASAHAQWKSGEYDSYKGAADYYNNNKNEIKSQLIRQHYTSALSGISASLSSDYGFANRQEKDILWIQVSKKHPEFEAQKENWEAFKEVSASIADTELTEETVAKLNSLLDYFESLKAKYPSEDKADKKMRYSSFYNKAKIYLLLDNPEAAKKEAEGLIENKYDAGDGKKLLKDAEALESLFKRNNMATRHFAIDLSNVEAPAEN